MTLDMKSWPTISLKGIAYDLPLPTGGAKAGLDGCQLGDRDECDACVRLREAEDVRLVDAMKKFKNGPVSKTRIDRED